MKKVLKGLLAFALSTLCVVALFPAMKAKADGGNLGRKSYILFEGDERVDRGETDKYSWINNASMYNYIINQYRDYDDNNIFYEIYDFNDYDKEIKTPDLKMTYDRNGLTYSRLNTCNVSSVVFYADRIGYAAGENEYSEVEFVLNDPANYNNGQLLVDLSAGTDYPVTMQTFNEIEWFYEVLSQNGEPVQGNGVFRFYLDGDDSLDLELEIDNEGNHYFRPIAGNSITGSVTVNIPEQRISDYVDLFVPLGPNYYSSVKFIFGEENNNVAGQDMGAYTLDLSSGSYACPDGDYNRLNWIWGILDLANNGYYSRVEEFSEGDNSWNIWYYDLDWDGNEDFSFSDKNGANLFTVLSTNSVSGGITFTMRGIPGDYYSSLTFAFTNNNGNGDDDGGTPYGNAVKNLVNTLGTANGTIYFTEGSAIPNRVMKALAENPNASLNFVFEFEGVKYDFLITSKDAAKYYDEKIDWYGHVWLKNHFQNRATN